MTKENTFLPTGYSIPETSNYMKLNEGQNRFRVLSSAIVGFQYWNVESKPVRLKTAPQGIPVDTKPEKDGTKKAPKPFWAFVVYNYESSRIQILEITQKGIMKSIKAKIENEAWGDPKMYDLVITREGSGFDTEYTVDPNPKTVLDKEIKGLYETTNINLEALYDGSDPFESTKSDEIEADWGDDDK